jgi:hypothetical protein
MNLRPLGLVTAGLAGLVMVCCLETSSAQALPPCAASGGDTSEGSDARGVTLRVSSSPRRLRAGSQVRWLFRVVNSSSESRRLIFPTSQVVDVELRRQGVARYRWSNRRGFLFMVTRRDLAPESAWSCHVGGFLSARPGRYSLTAWLTLGRQKPIVFRREYRNAAQCTQ